MSNPTLQEIADQAGVTQMTVSRVLTGSYVPKRADAVARAEEIRHIADELGYRPNAAGRAMRGGRFNAIGVVSPAGLTSSYVSSTMLGGMQEKAAEHDMHVVFAEVSPESLAGREELPRTLREVMVDGMLVNYCVEYPELMEDAISSMRLPVVTINMKRDFDNIRPDDLGGSRKATQRLIELGHRNIVHVPRKARNHFSVPEREAGYRNAMEAAGLEPRVMPSPVAVHEDNEMVAHVQWFRNMLSSSDAPTAVLAYSTVIGIALVEAVDSLGMSMGEDISFIGFASSVPKTALLTLGTMLIDDREIGKRVVDMLLRKIKEPEKRLSEVVIPMELREGRTVKEVAR